MFRKLPLNIIPVRKSKGYALKEYLNPTAMEIFQKFFPTKGLLVPGKRTNGFIPEHFYSRIFPTPPLGDA